MTRIGLVSCSSEKLGRAAPARELYCSQLFRLALKYAEQTCEHVFVLSGLHYLVQLDETIEPYDFKLSDQSKARREAWGYHVMWQLGARFPAQTLAERKTYTLVALAGASYVNALQSTGARETWSWSLPLEGMQIGERLRFLTNATQERTTPDDSRTDR